METGREIASIEVIPDSFVVGENNKMTLIFSTPVPLKSGFRLNITAPLDILPDNNIACRGGSGLSYW